MRSTWFSNAKVCWLIKMVTLCCCLLQGQYSFAQSVSATTQMSSTSTFGNLIDLQFSFQVLLNPGDTQTYNMWGELRSPAATQGRTLLILVPGLDYDHRYFDYPSGPSLANVAVANGYAVLNLDRLGLGYSDRPAASALGLPQDAYTVHQIVTAVRNGALSNYGFGKIVLIGHSYGSAISILDASTYNDVSAIVLTGITHMAGSGAQQAVASFVPASQDSVTAPQNPPVGYVTLRVGATGSLFFYPQTSTPSTIATSESIKGISTPVQLSSIGSLLAQQLGEQRIVVPVLTLFGDKDVLFGDNGTAARLQTEPRIYSHSRQSNAFVIPNTGHVLSLSTTVPLTDSIIFSWLGAVGVSPGP